MVDIRWGESSLEVRYILLAGVRDVPLSRFDIVALDRASISTTALRFAAHSEFI